MWAVGPWTSWIRGTGSPCSQKSVCNFWVPRNLSCPSVSMGHWFQDPLGFHSPRVLQSPRWNGAGQCTVGPRIRGLPVVNRKHYKCWLEKMLISGSMQFIPLWFKVSCIVWKEVSRCMSAVGQLGSGAKASSASLDTAVVSSTCQVWASVSLHWHRTWLFQTLVFANQRHVKHLLVFKFIIPRVLGSLS